MTDTAPADGMVEMRPARFVLVRHQGADLEARAVERSGPVVTLRSGAVWVRAEEEGPGVTVTHGASSVQVRAGSAVVEVADVEALLVVVSGRAAVRGVSPLPRTVAAGHASTLTLDGVFSDPAPIDANELAADRMIVENLARDALEADMGAPDGEVPGRAVRVDPPPPPTFDEAEDAEEAGRTDEGVRSDDVDPVEGSDPSPRTMGDRSGGSVREPSTPTSDLESALRGVGVVDDDDGSATDTEVAVDDGTESTAGDGRRRTKVLLVVLIVAFLVVAVIAAVLVSEQAGAVGAVGVGVDASVSGG